MAPRPTAVPAGSGPWLGWPGPWSGSPEFATPLVMPGGSLRGKRGGLAGVQPRRAVKRDDDAIDRWVLRRQKAKKRPAAGSANRTPTRASRDLAVVNSRENHEAPAPVVDRCPSVMEPSDHTPAGRADGR